VSSKDQKKKLILEKWNKFINGLTVYGLQRLLKTEIILMAIIWVAAILASVGYGLYNISKSISDYSRFDVITNAKIITPKAVTFPAITICNTGVYTRKTYDPKTDKFIDEKIFSEDLMKKFFDFESSLFNNTALTMDHIDFFSIPKDFGDCLKFNGGNDPLTIKSSLTTAILTINKEYNETSSITIEPVPPVYTIYVSNNSLNSYLRLEPVYLKQGAVHIINFQKTTIEHRLDEPYNRCSNKDKNYHQLNCIEMCMVKELASKYNCSMPSYYDRNNEKLNSCWKDPGDDEASFFFRYNNEYDACESGCVKECYSDQYNVIPTSSDPLFGETTFVFTLTDFSSLEIVQIPKMSGYLLFAAIGGSLGLFIGLRLMTIIEIVEFFVEVIFVFIFTMPNKPQKDGVSAL